MHDTDAGDRDETITIVSGLPRSGTSMMMRALEAGGLAPLTDNLRRADDDNPRGYYEFERVKDLPTGDWSWLDGARGKVVKVISALLPHLPLTHNYRVVFMLREMPEILASQRRMLINRGEDPAKVPDAELARMYASHLREIRRWLARQTAMAVLYVSYNDIVDDPATHLGRVADFVGCGLDAARMAEAVEPALHRQRA